MRVLHQFNYWKFITSVCCFVLLGLLVAANVKADGINVYVIEESNEESSFFNTACSEWLSENSTHFIKSNDTVLMPVREFADKFKYDVEWNGIERKVILSHKNGSREKLVFCVGSEIMYVNDSAINMQTECTILDDKTYVPLRAVAEKVGYYVSWSKGNYGDDIIWIHNMNLLSFDDLKANDSDYIKYEASEESMNNVSKYVLRNNRATNRGIALGNSYDEVIEKYGEPYNVEKNGEILCLKYLSVYYPNTSAFGWIEICIENKIVSEFRIYPI